MFKDTRLWSDLKTNQERAEFLRSGRAHETGIIAEALVEDVANAFDKLDENNNVYMDKIDQLQYANLRSHFNNMVTEILGANYFNVGLDVCECDRFSCEDIIKIVKKSWVERLFNW